MGKKNEFKMNGKNKGITIRYLWSKNISKKEIQRKLGVSRQVVEYWLNKDENKPHTRKLKLPMKYIKKIVKLAENRPVSEMPSRKIAMIINAQLKKDKVLDYKGEILKIRHSTVCKYLDKFLGKPRKIRKVFYLSEKQKEERVKFCRMILEKEIIQKDVFWTYETQIGLFNFFDDEIRLSKDNQKKLEKGDLDVYELITRPKKKFEKSIMVAIGISYNGLSKLLLLNGRENEFCYAQTILFYKEDIGNLIFEQDGAPAHTSKANKALLDKIFKNRWIQNPPNSPDLAYPIERLWGILKNRVKRRNPKTIEDLTKFTFEEWNSVPITLVQNLCKNYLKKIKKVIELGGARLEEEHLKQIRDKEGEYGEGHKWELRNDFKIMKIYNDQTLLKEKKREIRALNKLLNDIPKFYKKKSLKGLILLKEGIMVP